MKSNINKTLMRVDRLATTDEVLAAVLPVPDPIEECTEDLLNEIPVNIGGYVLLPAAELETSWIAEELTKGPDKWLN